MKKNSRSSASNIRVFVCGATGVGKSSFAESLATHCCGEIINADVFQMYTPLSIGTAKPDLSSVMVPHHLFSFLDSPINYSVTEYKKIALQTIDLVESNNKIPCIVGGSGFYLYSLFFPPCEHISSPAACPSSPASIHTSCAHENLTATCPLPSLTHKTFTHDDLYAIDPKRAGEIHPSDTYRIQRACEIFFSHGVLPSTCAPQFQNIEGATVFFVERDIQELYSIIDMRVDSMLQSGWLQEAANLSVEWCDFVKRKNVLGYPQLLDVIDKKMSFEDARLYIKQITRNYAKRQMTFNRRFLKKLQENNVIVHTINLTLSSSDLYIKQYCRDFWK
jgi:tRNA dimethylallyltransferase